jgi:lysophospholipase L1-like esterase
MTTWIKAIFINLVVVAGLLLALEGSIRLMLPHINPQHLDARLLAADRFGPSYGYKPNARGNDWGVEMLTDEHEFRIDPAFSRAKVGRTVLVLGDSVSVGLGVAAGDAYPSRLQQAWPDARILNASVTGYNLADYANVLEAILPAQPVEGIILGLCLNDVIGASQANILNVLSKQADHRPPQDQASNAGQQAEHHQGEAQQPPQPGPIEVSKDRYPNPIVRTIRYINDNYFNFNEALKRYSRTYLWLTRALRPTHHGIISMPMRWPIAMTQPWRPRRGPWPG